MGSVKLHLSRLGQPPSNSTGAATSSDVRGPDYMWTARRRLAQVCEARMFRLPRYIPTHTLAAVKWKLTDDIHVHSNTCSATCSFFCRVADAGHQGHDIALQPRTETHIGGWCK